MIGEGDMQRVVGAIRAAEARTSGEIFCVIAHASSSYGLVPIAWAAMVALLVPLVLIYLTTWPAGTIYLLQLGAFIVTAGILSLPAVRFRIVPRQTMRRRAHAEAVRQFLAHGLHLTERRTGVLIFASVAERHAEIVADARHQRQGRRERMGKLHRGHDRGHQGRAAGRWIRRRSRAVWGAARAAFSARRHQSGRTAQQTGGDVSAGGKADPSPNESTASTLLLGRRLTS